MDEDDIRRENPNDGWNRRKIGRRVERLPNILVALLLGAIGIFALLTTLIGGIELANDWPALLLAAVTFYLARLSWRARRGFVDFE